MNDDLKALAHTVGRQAYVPYSGEAVGVVAVFDGGRYVRGVRVECASFPLTIPAVVNACTTAFSLGMDAPLFLVKSRPFNELDRVYVTQLYDMKVHIEGHVMRLGHTATENAGTPVSPDISASIASPLSGAQWAATKAHIPYSEFPVGCVVVCKNGVHIPGCNVEHAQWPLTLCAERNAIGTAVSYDLKPTALYLSCPKDRNGTPCGACRQVIVEQASGIDIWMDRGNGHVSRSTGEALLPDRFDGNHVAHRSSSSENP